MKAKKKKVRASKRYFEGKEGVYFNPIRKELFLLTNKTKQLFINLKTMKDFYANTYDIQYVDFKKKRVRLVGMQHNVYIGEF